MCLLLRRLPDGVPPIQGVGTLAGGLGHSREHLGPERLRPAVTDRTERVDRQHPGEPLRDAHRSGGYQMASPREAHQEVYLTAGQMNSAG